jgi:hypothetical protein
LKKEYEEALTMLGQSEALFYRISGADAHFMAQYDLPNSSYSESVLWKSRF